MTREEAFEELKSMLTYYGFSSKEAEALTVALSALRPVSREQVEKLRGEWRSIH